MAAVEWDSVKSARKAQDKLHKTCERASETRERTLHGQEQLCDGKPGETVMRQWSISSQHTSTITCTAAPRVWHFSAFHYLSGQVSYFYLFEAILCLLYILAD